MIRRKNPQVVYSGKVGAKMRPRSAKPKPAKSKRETVACTGGPLNGRFIRMARGEGGNTLPICLFGQAGAYHYGKWVPSTQGVQP